MACWAKVKLKLPEGDFVLDVGTSGEMSLKKAGSTISTSSSEDGLSNSSNPPSKPPKPQQATEMQVTVNVKNNFYNESLDVYWISNTGEEVFMGGATAGEAMGLTTFEGHAFTARTHTTQVPAYPSRITISKSIENYSFGPNPSHTQTQTTPQTSMLETTPSHNPTERKLFFKYLNKRSSSVAVKFRCLVPKGVDVYYEDGKGGLPQGSLKLGRLFRYMHIFAYTYTMHHTHTHGFICIYTMYVP
ncbi:hypothetical protein EON63_13160 [archaeon]|nr:MAG: hypothetical protein EON63_13160 [archaeon]